jgi:hypothetical protein
LTEGHLKKGEATLFTLTNQRITRYIQQHRIVSIITAHAAVIMILTIALLSGSLGIRPNTVFASAASSTQIINEVFGPDAPAALRIATCESTLNPNAVNSTPVGGSHAEGLFQILYPSTWNTTSQAGASPFNAMANAIAAHEIFVRDGHSWREWECRA